MEPQFTTLDTDEIRENIYAGFWIRLGAMLIDFFINIPVVLLVMYLNSLGKEYNYYTILFNLVFSLFYFVYLPERYGGTPGKLGLGLKIIREDGQPIKWKEAFLRYSVLLAFFISNGLVMTYCLSQADDATFISMGWLKRTTYLTSFFPEYFKLYQWCFYIWYLIGIIVLVSDKKKRAVHDFMAGTVVVRTD
jgi:uncharacterized RDD family membrane protein YckC